MFKQEIIDSYKQTENEYLKLVPRIEAILLENLKKQKIKIHGINHRIKGEKSLAGKLSRPDKIYGSLSDITDLLGFRIVCYFEDDIDLIGRVVEQSFAIDYDNSIDKRQIAEPSLFGYQSLHYVCHLEDKTSLPFEIQIRSILQHTWAEIEHDLGYKFPESVPFSIRRKFSRLAGILELADSEFSSIRKEILEYRNTFESQNVGDHHISDELSLKSLLQHEEIAQAEEQLASKWQLSSTEELFYPRYLLKMLRHCKLDRSSSIATYIQNWRSEIILFSETYSRFTKKAWGFQISDFPHMKSGYLLFLACHHHVYHKEPLELGKLEDLRVFYKEMDYPENAQEAVKIAKVFLDVIGNDER